MANGLGMALLLGAFIVFALCFIGLFKPKFLQFNKSGDPPKRSHIAIALVFAPLLMFGIGGALLDPVEKQDSAQTNPEAATPLPATATETAPVAAPVAASEKKAPISKANLGVTPEEFRKSYNDFIGQIDRAWRVAEFDVTEGSANNTFMAKLGRGVGIVGSIDKFNKKIIDVMVIAGSGQDQDNIQAVAVLLSTAHALTKGASKQEISNAVNTVVTAALENIEKDDAPTQSRIVGNRKISATASPITGLMFSVSAAE